MHLCDVAVQEPFLVRASDKDTVARGSNSTRSTKVRSVVGDNRLEKVLETVLARTLLGIDHNVLLGLGTRLTDTDGVLEGLGDQEPSLGRRSRVLVLESLLGVLHIVVPASMRNSDKGVGLGVIVDTDVEELGVHDLLVHHAGPSDRNGLVSIDREHLLLLVLSREHVCLVIVHGASLGLSHPERVLLVASHQTSGHLQSPADLLGHIGTGVVIDHGGGGQVVLFLVFALPVGNVVAVVICHKEGRGIILLVGVDR